MRLTTLALIVFSLNISATVYSQKTKLSLDVNNQSIKEILYLIENQSEFRFIYESGKINLDKKVYVREKEQSVETILNRLFAKEGIRYEITENNLILINPTEKSNNSNIPVVTQGKKGSVTGTVTDTNGEPIIGANVVEKGTNNGTITDTEGKFSINVINGSTLYISYIGFLGQEVKVGKQENIEVQLREDTQKLDEIVVTALGISKSERALNYSSAQLSSEEISEVRSGNPISALTGKVAGLDITGNKRSGSGKIVLRGVGEIASGSTNKPLYVIDGVPVDNSNRTSASPFGGIDYGDVMSTINTDDIESISVLKGPSAAALYGSKASRGAILITTKSGIADQGVGVEFNSNTSMLMPYAGLNQYQQSYGTGQGGNYPKNRADAMTWSLDSWGAKLDPSVTSAFLDGSEQLYVSRYKPIDFYTNGMNTANTLSIMGGNKKATFRVSYGNEYYKDITPAFKYMKHNFNIRANGDLTSRLSYDIKVNFNVSNANQRPQSGHGIFNPTTILPIIGAETDLKKMEAMGRDISTGGLINNWDGALNPYYIMYQYKNNDQIYKGISSVSASYNLLKNLKLTVRQGLEMSDFNTSEQIPIGSKFKMSYAGRYASMEKGGMGKTNSKFLQSNTDYFAQYNTEFQDFTVDAMLGGNYWSQKTRDQSIYAADFIADGLYTPSNAKNQKSSYSIYNKKMYGLYGSLDLSYKRFLYLTFTARNDWSSTLPYNNNSYFYPSIGGSFIFSEVLDLPEWFSFGKLRGSWAQVGSDTDMYQLDMYYSLFPGGYPTDSGIDVYPGNINTSQLPPLDLKPMITKSTEFGVDLRFFKDRLGLDFAYYDNTTRDQIIAVPIPNSSGFSSRLMNAGSVSNRGIELTLSASPIKRNDLSWDMTLSLAHNKSKVNKLHESLKSIQMYFCEAMSVMAVEGEPYGIMYGSDYLYDDAGQIKRDENGYPLYDTSYNSYLGSAIPKVILGFTSSVNYKNFYLNFTIDSRLGHKYYSKTSRWMYEHGNHINTVKSRDDYYTFGKQGLDPLKLGKIQSVVASENVYDGSFIRMKEIAIGYKIPTKFAQKLSLKSANVSLVASNPFFIWRGSDFCDPTFSLNSSVGMEGIENGGEPSVRSLGINLNLKF